MLGRRPPQRAKAQVAHRSFSLEPLEPRQLLAGNVTAEVVRGSLLVTGDDADNDIVIDQVGLPADQFRITSGADATTINGLAGPLVFIGVTADLVIRLAAGNDTLEIADSIVPRDVRIDGGDGDNSVTIDPTTIGRNLRILNGTGSDSLVLLDCAVARQARIDNRDGTSATSIDNVFVGRSLVIKNRDGADALSFEDSIVGRTALIDNRDGGSATARTMAVLKPEEMLIPDVESSATTCPPLVANSRSAGVAGMKTPP